MATASTKKLTVSPFSISYSHLLPALLYASPGPYRHVCNVPICPLTKDGELSPSPSLDITDSNTPYGSQPCIYQPDAYALSDYPTYEHCYDAAKRYLASAPVPVPPVPTIDSLVYGAPKPGVPTTKRRGPLSSSALGAMLEHCRKKRRRVRLMPRVYH
ncbi:hypothetical protein H2248_008087 [Termitomyces sp. 'cryptogamus']|nr:hypothetical protein H2248_008087 [Termitomyces sp. 'cryptogamus']